MEKLSRDAIQWLIDAINEKSYKDQEQNNEAVNFIMQVKIESEKTTL